MHSLEYEEEDYDDDVDDLFGDEEDPLFVDTRKPVATPGAGPSTLAATTATKKKASAPTSGASSPAPKEGKFNMYKRLDELRAQKAVVPPPPAYGVASLRNLAMSVILANSARIWDIGGLEYPLCAELLDQLPREQLAEIETQSEHIKPDTDWLWETFVIDEYPLYYETCREKNGKHRSSGWRRMYHKAVQEAEERREQAMERVAARYKELDAQRASKKVVVMEGLVAPQKKKSGWGSWGGAKTHSLSGARRGASAAATYSQSQTQNKVLAKARAESNRARLALTKASSRFSGPPVVRTPRNATAAEVEQAMFSNPYAGRPKVAQGPRIPRPRVPLPMERRGELPAHIKPEVVEEKRGERFSLGAKAPRAPPVEDREKGKGKAREEIAPSKPTSFFEPKSRVLNAISDFKPLGSSSASGSGTKRSRDVDSPKRPRDLDSPKRSRELDSPKRPGELDSPKRAERSEKPKDERRSDDRDDIKRQRTDSPLAHARDSNRAAPIASPSGSPAPRTASPNGLSPAPSAPPRPLPVRPRKPQNLESVLFMKKKKPVKRP